MDSIEESGGGLSEESSRLGELVGESAMATAVFAAVDELLDYANGELGGNMLDAELAAVRVSRRVVRKLFQQKVQHELDRLDASSVRDPRRCVTCDMTMPSQGRRSRRWLSSLGQLELRRRYCDCGTCGQGRAPAQDALGLGASEFTPRLEEVCTLMSTTVPFGMARDLVEQVCGIQVSTKGVQEMSDRRGTRVLKRLKSEAQAQQPFDDSGLCREGVSRPSGTVIEEATPRCAYLEMDGVVPITRVEIEVSKLCDVDRVRQARAKVDKVRGGQGKRFTIVGREVKNAVLYSGDACVQSSIGRGCLIDKRYVSHLGGWEECAKRVWVEMRRQRFDEATELVIISDGAEWIRSMAKWLPVKCKMILDLFHVKHRIWEAVHALFGQNAKGCRLGQTSLRSGREGSRRERHRHLGANGDQARRCSRSRASPRPLPALQPRSHGRPRVSRSGSACG